MPLFGKKKEGFDLCRTGHGLGGTYNLGLQTGDEDGGVFTITCTTTSETRSQINQSKIAKSNSGFPDVHNKRNNLTDLPERDTGVINMERSKTMESDEMLGERIPLQFSRSTGNLPLQSSCDMQHLTVEDYFLGRARAFTGESKSSEGSTDTRHRIRITQVAPSHSSIFAADKEDENEWKLSIAKFTEKKHGPEFDKNFTKRIRSYYKAQDDLINTYEDLDLGIDDVTEKEADKETLSKKASLFAKITFVANLVLLIAKTAAAIISGSISIISSLIDSVVDLASGIVIWLTSRVMRKRNPYVYPQGRTRLEPIAIVVLSVIMSLASVQLIREAITKIVSLADGSGSIPNVDVATIVITSSTIVIKFILWMFCRRIKSPSIQVLAQDHRNDVLSNTVALIFGYIGSQDMRNKTGVLELVYLDPVGAILISIYIAINWWKTGYEQTRLLTGHTANPDFLKKLTWICINHHPEIKYIESLRAFHFGNNFLVEVDVILPEEMTLKESHDIAEPLQQKLERLSEVERAFVHVDYEYEHRSSDEHKVV